MEILIAVLIVLLSCLGLALGLMLRGKPLQTSCEGVACIGGGQCAVCPRRARAEEA
ncbi:hypothetical protein [Pseudooceanicola sp. HF7]|uniref:hypothetical protein n=1 Tax=Pseudooceanicola sp. HF7 TaxID=2721560 RepID=UPI0014312153|nr:hypothetical protein [Pseudooceanicola sp. HF7]NIZ07965.1 hypothetical protein [Pseudooceanicola sp. HF7]